MKIKHILHFLKDSIRREIGIFLFDTKVESSHFPGSNLQHIVFIRWDAKWGDAIISSFVFDHLRKTYPDIKISVVTSIMMSDFFHNYVDIDQVIEIPSRPSYKQLKTLAKQLGTVDLLVHFSFMKMKDLYFLSQVQAKNIAGLDDAIQRVNIKLGQTTQHKHFSQKFVTLLERIGVTTITPKYCIPLNSESVTQSEKFLAMKGKRPLLVINPYGSGKSRHLNMPNTKKIVLEAVKIRPNINVVILSTPDTAPKIQELCTALGHKNIFYYPACKTIYDAIALTSKASWVVSVDTAIVHIASGLNKPLLALYNPDEQNYSDWHPNSDKAQTCFSHKANPQNINAVDWGQLLADLSKLLQI